MGTPDAFDLNLSGALCARDDCNHRRDAHLTHGGTHRYECTSAGCGCQEFVLGGPDSLPDTERDFSRLADSSDPPPPEKK